MKMKEIFFCTFKVALTLISYSHHSEAHESYTSVDELGMWPTAFEELTKGIDQLIATEKVRLTRLKEIRDNLRQIELPTDLMGNDTAQSLPTDDSEGTQSQREIQVKRKRLMKNPVSAFVLLNRFRRATQEVDEILNDTKLFSQEPADDPTTEPHALSEIKKSISDLAHETPLEEDLAGIGQAILRLQAFYHLNTSKLISGLVLSNGVTPDGVSPLRMDAMDCFTIGRLAYESGQFAPSIIWFHAALERTLEQESPSEGPKIEILICDILDYMAYAAYKLGLLDYAARLTEAWLERDPGNERAQENLGLYLEELSAESDKDSSNKTESSTQMEKKQGVDIDGESGAELSSKFGYYPANFKLDKYQVEDDEIVSHLCRGSDYSAIKLNRNKCETPRRAVMQNGHFFPGLRLEVLHKSPRIVRVHNMITKKEAKHLRRIARPNLERSTITSSEGLRTSDFRIAKTAWLQARTDPIVDRVERRLGSVLNLGMEKSEFLQVVNYGLGGFYGPHLDSARVSSSSAKGCNESVLAQQLARGDRLATILIYLNAVEAGGATVFPRLNLTVRSIDRSAVVWSNILENGFSDERTLHTGCPVLIGSKWIATKWPHEEANSFRRPCKSRIINKRP